MVQGGAGAEAGESADECVFAVHTEHAELPGRLRLRGRADGVAFSSTQLWNPAFQCTAQKVGTRGSGRLRCFCGVLRTQAPMPHCLGGEASQEQREGHFTKQLRTALGSSGEWPCVPTPKAGSKQPLPHLGLQKSYLDIALVGRPYASLHVHAERPLGLLRRDGAHLGGAVSAGHVAGEGAHWECAGQGAWPSQPASSGAGRRSVTPPPQPSRRNGPDTQCGQHVLERRAHNALGLWQQAALRQAGGALMGR